MNNFHLCPEGKRLVDLADAALNAKATDAKALNREYLRHRVDCPDCSKPISMDEYLAKIEGWQEDAE